MSKARNARNAIAFCYSPRRGGEIRTKDETSGEGMTMGRASKFKKLAAKIEQDKETERMKGMSFNQRVAYQQNKIPLIERANLVIDGVTLTYESVQSPFHTYRYPLTYDAIPLEYKNIYHKGQKVAGNRFFNGHTLASQGVTMKPSIPQATFNRHLHLILASWDYPHEHKKALAAWLIDKCCIIPEELV